MRPWRPSPVQMLHGAHVEIEQTLALIALFLVLLSQFDDLFEDLHVKPFAFGLRKHFLLLFVQLLQFNVKIFDPFDERANLAAGNGDVGHGVSPDKWKCENDRKEITNVLTETNFAAQSRLSQAGNPTSAACKAASIVRNARLGYLIDPGRNCLVDPSNGASQIDEIGVVAYRAKFRVCCLVSRLG